MSTGSPLLLAVLLASAAAAAPTTPSAARAAFLQTLGARSSGLSPDAPMPALVALFSPTDKLDAKARLDAVDRKNLSAPALTELDEAYRLLGFAPPLLTRRPPPDGRVGGAVRAGATANARAQVVANQLLAGLSVEEGGVGQGAAPDARSGLVATARPHKPISPVVPPEIGGGESEAYVSPGARRPTAIERAWANIAGLVSYHLHQTTPAEAKRVDALLTRLETTETGRKLIANLGGIANIRKEVDIKFADTGAANLNAYTRPLLKPDAQGRTRALVINTALLNQPDDLVVPIVGHELRHILDWKTVGPLGHGLTIPSEFSAHTTQIHIYEDMMRGVPPENRESLHSGPQWAYQVMIARIWEDHILERYPTPDSFAASFRDKTSRKIAPAIYRDLRNAVVRAGTPQLYFHIDGPDTGLYRVMSSETDILNTVAAKNSAEITSEDRLAIKRRADILRMSEDRDQAFRLRTGFVVPGTDR